ncbi:hypothetical protein JGS39_24050 [Streptomyces sp. P01-B04]|uniref:hypothetical protein n=1 Tax=Streptomyces poriferorum TaxID=2798799 RepID=UPI001C5E6BEB|nr:hypothetical protein [Streptomyces poriferorum]MBW5252035.1 hypothetical protein [Streptomyces poriferorum]MBW5260205.1 hypothetical protein [Streptomyces poriferorum]
MRFPEALDGALRGWYPVAGIKSPISQRRGFTARLNALERALGGRRAAAAAMGIGYSTWGAWFAKKPRGASAASLRKVDDAYAQLLRTKTVTKTSGPGLMVVTADVVADPRKSRYRNKTLRRQFKADQLGKAGIRPIVLRWQNGGSPADVAAVAIAAIKSAYSTEFAFEGDSVTVELS